MLGDRFLLLYYVASLFSIVVSVCLASPLIGVHPSDEKYFDSDVIQCKDSSKTFTRDRLNDNFCDCPDGTDEPGTAACPAAKFYCKNVGSSPEFIFSSHVNDRICDCCDGSDEYESNIYCPNTCIMGGISMLAQLGSTDSKETRSRTNLQVQDMFQKLQGLKFVLAIQLAALLIGLLVILWMLRRSVGSKRRRCR